jgi:PKD repeat protein
MPFNYVVTIVMENKGICAIIPNIDCSSPSNITAPYMSYLALSDGLATNYTAIAQLSLPNYLDLFSGQDWGCTVDAPPNSNACTSNAWNSANANLADRLEASGLTWKAYMENMPINCDTNSAGNYSARHNPFVYFNDIVSNPMRCNRVIPAGINASALTSDLSSLSTASNFMWLTPNLCNDMHGDSSCTNGCINGNLTCITDGDAYLSQLVPRILSSYVFTTQQAALFITFDEGSGYCPKGGLAPDCVYSVWAGPAAKMAYSSATSYSHYSYPATFEAAWTLEPLNSNDALAAPMSEFFKTPFPPRFTLNPSSPEVGQQVTLTAFASGGTPPYSINWTFGDGSTSMSNPSTHTYTSSGSFTIVVTIVDANLVMANYSQTISIANLPSVSFLFSPASPEAGSIVTTIVTFSAKTTGGVGPFTFNWTFGDNGVAVGSQATHAYLAPGLYTANVTATDSNGYDAASSQRVYVASALSVSFNETFSSFQVNKAVTFIATTDGGVGAVSLTWNFGDGSTGVGSTATHAYTTAGSYTVVLTGTDTGSPQLVAISQQLISVANFPSGSATGPTGQPCLASLCLSRNIWILTIAGAAVLGLGTSVHVARSRSRRASSVPSTFPCCNFSSLRTIFFLNVLFHSIP